LPVRKMRRAVSTSMSWTISAIRRRYLAFASAGIELAPRPKPGGRRIAVPTACRSSPCPRRDASLASDVAVGVLHEVAELFGIVNGRRREIFAGGENGQGGRRFPAGNRPRPSREAMSGGKSSARVPESHERREIVRRRPGKR
jgi:hypothetical protein